jgi:hypothetical protein
MVAFVAETLNGCRGGTFLDENGVVWRGELTKAHCLVNGTEQIGVYAADAREGWADVRSPQWKGASEVTADQPHGVPTVRLHGRVEITAGGPLDRIDAKIGNVAIAEARMAVKALRQSMDPMPHLADRLEAALNAEA